MRNYWLDEEKRGLFWKGSYMKVTLNGKETLRSHAKKKEMRKRK